ncbi:MAG TPA: hypothetical protein VH370_09415 [Humisphaera sp.]|jgi:hypothetical protein|nr:hypothetical protein [Humisphaera sp.]
MIEPTVPYPPRFRWLKRILLAIAFLIAGLFVIRAIAVHRALREFDDEVAALKSKGQPTDWADFSQPELADDQNAAVLMLKAAQAMTTTIQQQHAAGLIRRNEADEQTLAIADAWVQINAAPLALIRNARDVPGIRWLSSDGSGRANNSYAAARRLEPLALLLLTAADSAARHADALSFAEYECDLSGLAHIAGRAPSGALYLNAFVTWGIDMDGPRLATAPMNPQARDALSRLIQDLLDDQAIAQWTIQSIAEERVMMIQGLRHSVINPEPGGHDLYDRAFVFAFRAPLIGKTVRQLRGFDLAAEAARKSTFPTDIDDNYYLQYRPMEEAIEKRWRSFNKVGTPGGWVSQRRRQIAYHRMYVVALAVRMYQADHDGSFPATLDELLPRYLDRIPVDPYDETGKSLQYVTQPNVMVFDANPMTVSPGGPRVQRIELLRAPPPTQPSVMDN